jgi:hypothetical protein
MLSMRSAVGYFEAGVVYSLPIGCARIGPCGLCKKQWTGLSSVIIVCFVRLLMDIVVLSRGQERWSVVE